MSQGAAPEPGGTALTLALSPEGEGTRVEPPAPHRPFSPLGEVGWIDKPAATIARRCVGKGGLVATAFRLVNDAPGTDPVAVALFDGLITTTANLDAD